MFSNFLKTALRNIFRHKSYVFINMVGLSVGFACSILIFLFVIHELSYDKFNKKYDRIYRIYLVGKFGESEVKGAWTAPPTAKAFLEEFPEVESAVRMTQWDEVLVRVDNKKFIEYNLAFADSTFFDIFSIPMIEGNPKTALSLPHNVVLTKSQAIKYFGYQDAIGQHLRIGTDTSLYTVTGVMQDVPENSHFNFNMLVSFLSHQRANDDFWLMNSFSTYLLLKEGASAEELQKKIPHIIEKYVGPEVQKVMGMNLKAFTDRGNKYGLFLQPLSDIHLNPEIDSEFKKANDRKYIYIFSIIAVLILVVAGINYMNLSTARSAIRSREVGLRKVVGSSRSLLIRQFLIESIFLSIISMTIAILIIELLLPLFNQFLQVNLSVGYFERWYVIPALVLITLFIGVFSGSYPAFFLASFKPVKVLYGKLKMGISNGIVRSILVVFQFWVSIVLILSSIIIYRQIHFMLTRDMGFDKEQLLVIRRTDALGNHTQTFKEEVNKVPGVISSTNSTAVPGYPNNNNGFQIEGRSPEQTFLMSVNWIDYDYIKTYRINMAEGRDFDRTYPSDTATMILNEEAVRRFELKDPFNTRFIQPGLSYNERTFFNVIGVTKNFNFQSLQRTIEPHVFILKPKWWGWAGYVTIRVKADNIKSTIAGIEKVWQNYTNDEPFQYFFLDQEFEKFYKEEKRTAKIVMAFSILAIFIASLGLFGLTSFATEQRAKEISLRKVLGSSINKIILLFTKEVSILIVISTILAWVVTYFVMNKWLQNFYYRIHLSVYEFIYSFIIALIIAMLTVCYRTYKAAITNPADILKYE